MTDTENLVLWSFPTRVVFGGGAARQCGVEAVRLAGHRALLVADKGIEAAGLLHPIRSALDAAGIAHESVLDISSNPLESEVLGAARVYDTFKADIVIGVGGGSVLDVAKLVRLAVTHPAPLARYDDAIGGGEKIVGTLPPMIAIPTTAGTGSEVGRSGVVTIQATNRKTVIFSPLLIPDVAILDPGMTQTMPPSMSAATGMDALTHCVEAYCSSGDHPMADAIALGGIQLCHRSLRAAVEDGADLGARGDMLKAAMMGAVAFQKGLGACHSLAHPLSAELGMHHGLANAICLPAVLDFNRSVIPDRIAEIARHLGVRSDEANTLSFECAGAVRALRRVIGLPSDLRSQGIAESDLPRLAALAFADPCHNLNPRSCSQDDLLALYKACFDDA
ncbi:MAG: iron-containing alcohol dehydrogenase [Myxococcales bacterium]|nr:iron-containing alcohol dehydrogenase [Myxococcales bacterium]MDH3484009.1 iron-containing alcohol dehydrogenase [Myxococcales bacterium]